jgi:hypothetical protein
MSRNHTSSSSRPSKRASLTALVLAATFAVAALAGPASAEGPLINLVDRNKDGFVCVQGIGKGDAVAIDDFNNPGQKAGCPGDFALTPVSP